MFFLIILFHLLLVLFGYLLSISLLSSMYLLSYTFSIVDLFKIQFRFNSFQHFADYFSTLCQTVVVMDRLAQLPTNNNPETDIFNSTQYPPSKFRFFNEWLIAGNLVGSGCDKNLNFARILPGGSTVK